MSTKKTPLTIGRLAKAAGVNIETVRYYQRQNLIVEPIKPESGFRHYPEETIDHIQFVKRAQQLGFSLKEIEQLLLLGSQHCNDVQALAEEKRALVAKQIKGLQTIQYALDELILSCKNDESADHCAFIDGLNQQGFFDK